MTHELIGTVVWAAATVFTVVSVRGVVMHYLEAREAEDDFSQRLETIEGELRDNDGVTQLGKRVHELERRVLSLKAGKAMRAHKGD